MVEQICDDCGKPISVCNAEAMVREMRKRGHELPEIHALQEAITAEEARSQEVIAAMRSERDAIAAVAFEAAANRGERTPYYGCTQVRDAIRALTPTHARATLDRMLRQAKAEGMKEAAKLSTRGDDRATILARAAEIEAGDTP